MATVPRREPAAPPSDGERIDTGRRDAPDPTRARGQDGEPLPHWARERIERAVAPYRSLLSEADLDWMRAQLALALQDDDAIAGAARAAHGAGESSGTVPRRGGR